MRRPGKRATIALGILALWIAGLGVLVQRELFRPHAEHLAEAGMRVTPSATFYAVLQRGEQIGFASSTVDTTDGGITQVDYLVADLPIAGKLHRASARTSVRLTRALRLRSFSLDVDADLTPIKASGVVVGDSLLLLVLKGIAGQPADTQRVKLTGPVLLPTLLPIAVALGQRPHTGATYTLPVFDPASMSPRDVQITVEAESVFVLQDSSIYDRGAKRWFGARPDTVRAWKLNTPATGTPGGTSGFKRWVAEQRRVGLVNQMLGLTLERRPYEVAFENWKADALKRGARGTADRDIYESTAISANKKLRGNLRELKGRRTGGGLVGV